MARKKGNKNRGKITRPMSDLMYRHYLGVLIGAQDAFYGGIPAVYDLGPGQRPSRALEAFLYVAKREKIPVQLTLGNKGQSIFFVFLDEKPEKQIELPAESFRTEAAGS